MQNAAEIVLDELVRTGLIITREMDVRTLISTLVEQSLDITRSDLAAFYLIPDFDPKGKHRGPKPIHKHHRTGLPLMFRRGRFHVPDTMEGESELVEFLDESEEAVCLTERKKGPFGELLLHPSMESGMAFPIHAGGNLLGVLVVNSILPLFYDRKKFNFLNSLSSLAGGMLDNVRLFEELKESLETIREMERYQENIFSSMTNLLVTLDREGKIRYFNQSAMETLELSSKSMGVPLEEVFRDKIDPTILTAIRNSEEKKEELIGIEGIYSTGVRELDFSLNVTPLLSQHKAVLGSTLLFTDQTREKELQHEVQGITEERRVIKDMFSRYLSKEIVQNLVRSPHRVHPGGESMVATVFFADIRGYTSFSEGHSPEYIVEVLNDYFSEAVEVVIKYRGYIDKFIGDCIMAAWGVPICNPGEDAISAVSAAVEIQELVASTNRKFFTGQAANLKIGIGMHTGPLVAGNLGSSRKMNYTVIGDTVNLASRLEGISKAGEIIITSNTAELLDDRFHLEEREPVQVKGKKDPIPIYSVIGLRSR